MFTKVTKLEFCTISLRKDGIVENRFDWDTEYLIEGKHIDEIASVLIEISNGERRPIISIAGQYGSMTVEARKADISKAGVYTLALALVIKELPQRLLANFYFKVKKVDYPIKSFKIEEDAVEWLEEQVRLNQKIG